jgi:hypothetical protein
MGVVSIGMASAGSIGSSRISGLGTAGLSLEASGFCLLALAALRLANEEVISYTLQMESGSI